ncbi:FAD-dependent oxidoreductase [Pseudonocardia sp. GCM10023141]|uniref:FAD-dependent oxidoreductase n=1 Tax=Pseudonocardia sp. GCM10023141 TaxID=3252653 RepID=UPI00360BEEBD
MHVLIIGAGTGGLCLAQALRTAGVSVAVYERDRTRNDGLFGYRVGISPDGSRALHACLPERLFDTFVATTAITPNWFSMYTEQYGELLSLGGFDTAAADDPGAERSVSRMTLRQVLLTGIEDIVSFDKKFTRYEQHADGTVTAHFADGTSATGDVLVGADGTGSPVRRQYLPHATLQETDLFGITAKLPLTEQTRALLPPKVLRGVSMVTAPGGDGMIIHVMEFPWDADGVKQGIGGNDADLLRAWPGLNFDNTRDYIMLGFSSHRRRLPADFMSLDGPALHAIMLDRTQRWHPDLRALVAGSDPSTCFPLNIRTTDRVPPWASSTVTLIGDAIHTMTPGLGVGANTALRDARILAEGLIAAERGERTVLDAVGAYEQQMHGYAWDLVAKSLERFDADAAIYRSGIGGRLALAGMRTGMRLVNHLPPLKRKMAAATSADRGHDRLE